MGECARTAVAVSLRSLGCLLALTALGLLAASPTHADAAPATVKGTIAGPGLPDAGDGVAGVQAVNAETGVVGGADYTSGARDRWRLSVAPGPYAVAAASVPFGGGKLTDRFVAFVAARSGKTESLKLRLKPKSRQRRSGQPGRPARVPDGFGDVDVDFPAIWVKEFGVQSGDPELGSLGRGMDDMLITDIIAGVAGVPGCRAVIVERERIDDILNEHRLQQLPQFDPDTRIRQGRLIRDNASVSGTIAEAGGHVIITATYSNRRTGRSKTVTVQGPAEDVFALEQELARKLVEAICETLPDTYSGPFSGSAADSEMTRTWSGTATFQKVERPDQRAEQCEAAGTVCYDLVGGEVTWQISTTPGAMCSYSTPPKTTSLQPSLGALVIENSGADTPGYGGGIAIEDSATLTIDCGGDPGDVPNFPLQDCCWSTPGGGTGYSEHAQDGGRRLQGTRQSSGGGVATSFTWDFTAAQ